jgi:hypothetical protein
MNSKKIFAGLLTACFFFVHVIGAVVVLEIEHVHHGDEDHQHDFADSSNYHDHAPLDSQEDDAPENDQPEDDSPLPSHSHQLSLNVAVATIVSDFLELAPDLAVPIEGSRLENVLWPDGPSFEVIKPPQLA